MTKKFLTAMLGVSLAFGMTVIGCDLDSEGSFEFKVSYYNGFGGGAITKIEFIDGSNKDAPVLATETVQLGSGEMSNVYRVSGFTNKEGDGRIFGVKVTFNDGGFYFDWSSARNGSKINVSVSAPLLVMTFSDGNW
ncbi:MAG: hypothetical protein LBQ77_03060 [Treponema sp.]|jgi:hypothetical protein|nr:hypothetical protein [Treponema sp.]